MCKKAYLTLSNGMIFEGEAFGRIGESIGEIVFTTGMSGYTETLTDKSYCGQIILQTFPLIGNYGVNAIDFESNSIFAKGYIVREYCKEPSNSLCKETLEEFLIQHKIIGISNIDTRSLTRVIREFGTLNAKLSYKEPEEDDFLKIQNYSIKNAVSLVSSKNIKKLSSGKIRVALMDFGVKNGIINALISRDCEVWSFPYNSSVSDIMQIKPNGIMLSNGPGNPAAAENLPIVNTIKLLCRANIPIFGICLGHQLLALSNNYKTKKLKFGHRGANHPVKEISTGRVYVTSQNHGYEVEAKDSDFINLNDGSCEGLDYGLNFSVQFHPEGKPGPLDTEFLFDKFIKRILQNG